MTPNQALREAIRLCNTQRGLADRAGISQQRISAMLRRTGVASAESALVIAAATDFSVRPHDLRPDIYPNPCDGIPSKNKSSIARKTNPENPQFRGCTDPQVHC